MQSVLDPHGPEAEATAALAWQLFGGGALVFVAVVAAIALAVRSPRARALLGRDATIVALGAGLPIVALTAALIHSLRMEAEFVRDDPPGLTLEVTGERWWWRVRYLHADGRPDFWTANEIRIPTDTSIELRLASADVIHSFWVPALAGKVDMIPGRTNRLGLRATRAGVFRGQCAEYCGGAHAMMAFHVVAQAPAEFEKWRERQRAPAAEPATDQARRGRDVFLSSGCSVCHRVAGTPALGSVGPDLTHVGSRLHVMSGELRNHRGTLAGWIASAQHLKPENLMPSYGQTLSGVDLRALATWLEGLE